MSEGSVVLSGNEEDGVARSSRKRTRTEERSEESVSGASKKSKWGVVTTSLGESSSSSSSSGVMKNSAELPATSSSLEPSASKPISDVNNTIVIVE